MFPKSEQSLKKIAEELNRSIGRTNHIDLAVVRWEKDSIPILVHVLSRLLHQQIADMTAPTYHSNYVEPARPSTEMAGSGTEEEFNGAVESYRTFALPRMASESFHRVGGVAGSNLVTPTKFKFTQVQVPMEGPSGRTKLLMSNAIHVNGFHHVAIRAFDFEASVQFYAETLGLAVAHLWGEGDGRGALLDTGNGNFLEIFAGGASESQPEGAWFHIALACSDVNAAIETVRDSGRPVTMEPKDIVIPSTPSLPVRIAFFLGPNGESVELFQTL